MCTTRTADDTHTPTHTHTHPPVHPLGQRRDESDLIVAKTNIVWSMAIVKHRAVKLASKIAPGT